MVFDCVKVFSATKSRDREGLGDRVTDFLQDFDGEIVETRVVQSSDNEFHCLSIVIFGNEKKKRRRGNGRNGNPDKPKRERKG